VKATPRGSGSADLAAEVADALLDLQDLEAQHADAAARAKALVRLAAREQWLPAVQKRDALGVQVIDAEKRVEYLSLRWRVKRSRLRNPAEPSRG